MEYKEFNLKMKDYAEKISIKLDDKMIEKFYKYMELLLIWNEKVNLTAITDEEEIIVKHFIDSLTITEMIKNNSKVIDIGTGAGFPGIPLIIYNNTIKITLLDSLNKRINFLKVVVDTLKLENVEIIHGRAEDFARLNNYREKYDYSISRAVAPLNILIEYLAPYIKINGKILAMKGNNISEEIKSANNALSELHCKIIDSKEIELPNKYGIRYITQIEKNQKTSVLYPRKAGIPKKKPL